MTTTYNNVIILADRAISAATQENVVMITQETLKDLFTYDPDTGEFWWRKSAKGRRLNRPAGTVDRGYRMIHIDGEYYQAQRLAWIYMYGEVPEGQRIRFDDGDTKNLRISNLRLARTRQEHNALFRERHPTANRQHMYKKLYQGMTIAAFDTMLAGQGGVCAICKLPEKDADNTGTGKIRNLNIDHDHTTNDVRGILCSACNRALGLLADDPERVRAAAEYLERHMKKKAAA